MDNRVNKHHFNDCEFIEFLQDKKCVCCDQVQNNQPSEESNLYETKVQKLLASSTFTKLLAKYELLFQLPFDNYEYLINTSYVEMGDENIWWMILILLFMLPPSIIIMLPSLLVSSAIAFVLLIDRLSYCGD